MKHRFSIAATLTILFPASLAGTSFLMWTWKRFFEPQGTSVQMDEREMHRC